MKSALSTSFRKHFGDLPDPRIDRTKLHKLFDILVIAICAVICGADTWVEVEAFGQAKETWLRSFLELPNGIPSHDTFGRVFARLDPTQFEARFLAWVRALAELVPGQVVPIDGKELRRSHDRPDKSGGRQPSASSVPGRRLTALFSVKSRSATNPMRSPPFQSSYRH